MHQLQPIPIRQRKLAPLRAHRDYPIPFQRNAVSLQPQRPDQIGQRSPSRQPIETPRLPIQSKRECHRTQPTSPNPRALLSHEHQALIPKQEIDVQSGGGLLNIGAVRRLSVGGGVFICIGTDGGGFASALAGRCAMDVRLRTLAGRMAVWVGVALGLAGAGVGSFARAQEGGGGAEEGLRGGQMVQGTVTVGGADRLMIKTEAGETYQVVTTANTRVMKDRQPVKVGEIAVGSGVGAMGLMDAPTKTVHAMFVMVIDPEQVKKAREGLGKAYIVGKVMKIDETTLTILRSDGVTQKIEVDEGTSFKRGAGGMRMGMMGGPVSGGGRPGGGNGAGAGSNGGQEGGSAARTRAPTESITLMDVKLGDTVAGQGALKNGVFVPKDLNVMTPGARRQRPRNPDGSPGAAPSPAGGQTGAGSGDASGSPPAP